MARTRTSAARRPCGGAEPAVASKRVAGADTLTEQAYRLIEEQIARCG